MRLGIHRGQGEGKRGDNSLEEERLGFEIVRNGRYDDEKDPRR